MKPLFFPLALLALSATAQAASLADALQHCDSRFFSELYARQHQLKQAAPLTSDAQHHAWFTPPKDGSDILWFAQPLREGKLSYTGYFQRHNNLQEMGRYYFWGLIVEQTPDEVRAALPAMHWQQAASDYYLNPMIKRAGEQQWQPNTTAVSGIAPAQDSVEKLAMLNITDGKTMLLCSVQGKVTDADLQVLRPDLTGAKK